MSIKDQPLDKIGEKIEAFLKKMLNPKAILQLHISSVLKVRGEKLEKQMLKWEESLVYFKFGLVLGYILMLWGGSEHVR